MTNLEVLKEQCELIRMIENLKEKQKKRNKKPCKKTS